MVVNCSKNFSLKFLQIEGRFPTQHREVPRLSVDFVAQQLNLAAAIWLDFPMKGSSNERVHSKIRAVMGFHPITTDDTARLQTYLREQIIPQDQDIRHLLSTALDWCQENKVEPPSEGRLMRLLKSSIHTFEVTTHPIQRSLSRQALSEWLSMDYGLYWPYFGGSLISGNTPVHIPRF